MTHRWWVVALALAGLGQANCPSDDPCDGRDNDHDGQVDEGYDLDGDGFAGGEGCEALDPARLDCDDDDPTVNPAEEERCDGGDDDCDGLTDEGFPQGDEDGDGAIACWDCDDHDPQRAPGLPEIIGDAIDNDCSGASEVTAWVVLGPSPDPNVPSYPSIQAAVDDSPPGGVIAVTPGTWKENVRVTGGQITVFGQGGRDVTLVDARGRGPAFTLSQLASVELRGLSVTGGEADVGGGILVDGAFARIYDSAVYGCLAFERGGGIAVVNNGDLKLYGVDVRGNEAWHGGGIYALGADLSADDLNVADNLAYTLVSSVIQPSSGGGKTWNEVVTGYEGAGGGIYLDVGAIGSLRRAAVTGNTSVEGGGIYHDGTTLALTDAIVSGNSAWLPVSVRDASAAPAPVVETLYDGSGGGIYAVDRLWLEDVTLDDNASLSGGGLWASGGEIQVDGLSFTGDVAHGVLRRLVDPLGELDIYAGEGGALFLGPGAYLTGERLAITGGRSIYGGGIYATGATLLLSGVRITDSVADALSVDDQRYGSQSWLGTGGGAFLASSRMDWESVVVSGSRARILGGGILVSGGSGDNRLTNATVVGCGAPAGGGLRFDNPGGAWLLTNLIVAYSSEGGGISGTPPPEAFSFSDVYGNEGGDWAGGASPGAGPGMISEDPAFVRFTPEGGDDDLHLLAQSPCVDTGDPDPLYTDPDASRSDMGGYGGPAASLLSATGR